MNEGDFQEAYRLYMKYTKYVLIIEHINSRMTSAGLVVHKNNTSDDIDPLHLCRLGLSELRKHPKFSLTENKVDIKAIEKVSCEDGNMARRYNS
jgi:hypothetical protein